MTPSPATDSDPVDALRQSLCQPPLQADVETLAGLWLVERISWSAPCPAGLEDHPDLSYRVRGALARALYTMTARRTRSGALLASPRSVLLEPLGHVDQAHEMPKPLVVRAWIAGAILHVEVLLLGAAATFAPSVGEALQQAMSGGLDLKPHGGLRIAIEGVAPRTGRFPPIVWPDNPEVAILRFRTPFTVRRVDAIVADAPAILRALPRRVAGLARWQGVKLIFDKAKIGQAIAALSLDDADMFLFEDRRHSIRQGNAPIPVRGYLGSLCARGALRDIAPYLALCATMNAGSQAAIGAGWFDLALA